MLILNVRFKAVRVILYLDESKLFFIAGEINMFEVKTNCLLSLPQV